MTKPEPLATLPLSLMLLMSGCGFGWTPAFDESIDLAQLDSVDVAPAQEALSFARYLGPQGPRVLLVRRHEAGRVHGVDLSAALGRVVEDPIAAFEAEGYARLEALATSTSTELALDVARLTTPVDVSHQQIAAGTNYPEHADEVGVGDNPPYLFPELIEPTPWNANVSVGQALLDYEVELGFVTLAPVPTGQVPHQMGLVLVNDFTDRATLLRHLDVNDVTSGKGFTTGKSFPGFLPLGTMFVVPKDFRAFAAKAHLHLYVDLELRQRDFVSSAIWDIDEIFEQIWAREGVTWAHRGAQYPLFDAERGGVEDHVLILSGTPYGVVYNEVGAEQRANGFSDWLFFGWGDSIPAHAIEDYIFDAKAEGIFLLTGQRVDIHVDGLGVLRNEVVP